MEYSMTPSTILVTIPSDWQTSAGISHNDTSTNIAGIMEDPTIGVSVIAVVVMILLIMVVILRFMAHQKGTYYTHEEALAFKSDPEVQEVTEDPEDPEDPEEDEP